MGKGIENRLVRRAGKRGGTRGRGAGGREESKVKKIGKKGTRDGGRG